MTITPKKPDLNWLNSYLEPSLIESKAYTIDTPKVDFKLDQNESPYDWPEELKKKVVNKVLEQNWNKYPPAYSEELESLVADYANVSKENVLLSPGSNHIVALTLSLFSKRLKGKVVCARPSFALYESHCRYDGIPYEAWELNSELQYDESKLPELTPGSMVMFASPNNPVGNVLPRANLKALLEKHPEVLFIGDEAYFEFAKEPYTDLLKDHGNLLLIRTFSKTMGAAGIRLGYLLGAEEYISQLKKVMLPFLVNQFTLVAATEVLKDESAKAQFRETVQNTIKERDLLNSSLVEIGKQKNFEVINSQANFLLLRWPDNDQANVAYQKIIDGGVLVRNVCMGPGLKGCLRLTIGSPSENKVVHDIFKNL